MRTSEPWTLPPFIGRDAEVASLRSCVAAAAHGSGRVVLVCGDAGIGKSRLVEHALGSNRNHPVRYVTVEPFAIDRPFGPLLEALSLRWRDILPKAPTTPIDFQVDHLPNFLAAEAISEAFDGLGSDCQATIVIDGLHWADEQTLRLLTPLARQLRDLPVVLIGLTRLDPRTEPAFRAAEAEGATVIPLEPVSDPVARQLAESCLGPGAGADEIDGVVAAANGNPLMILAIATTAGVPGSDTFGAVVRSTYAAIGTAATTVLRAAALLGRHINVAEVSAVSGVSERDVLAVLESAAASPLVGNDQRGFAIRHDLLLDAMVAECPPHHARIVHRAAAKVLRANGAAPPRIVHHFLAAGLDQAADDDLTGLAEAIVRSDPTSALRIVDSMLVARPPAHHDRRLLMVRVQALAAVGRAEEAAQQSVILIAQGVAPEEEAALRRELALSALVRGDPVGAAEEMARAGELASDPMAKGRALGEMAIARLVLRDPRGAAVDAMEAYDIAKATGDVITEICASGVLVMDHLMMGEGAQAVAMYEGLRTLVDVPAAVDALMYQPHLFMTMYLRDVGRYADAMKAAAEGLAVARRHAHVWSIPAFDCFLGQLSFDIGELADAHAYVSAAVNGSRTIDPFGVSLWGFGLLAHIAGLNGEHDEMNAMAARVEQLLFEGKIGLGTESAILGLVRAKELAGDEAASTECLDIGMALLAAMPAVTAINTLHIDVARRRGTDGQQLALVPCAVNTARERASRALGEGDLALIDEAVAALDQAGARREALELGWLTLRAHRGDSGRAAWQDLRRRVQNLAAAFEAKAVIGEFGSDRARPRRRDAFALTPAEQQVANLISQGLSNSDIAHRLSLSRRTVESHCGAMYRKLGVTSRVQVARLLLGHGMQK